MIPIACKSQAEVNLKLSCQSSSSIARTQSNNGNEEEAASKITIAKSENASLKFVATLGETYALQMEKEEPSTLSDSE